VKVARFLRHSVVSTKISSAVIGLFSAYSVLCSVIVWHITGQIRPR